MGKIVHLSHTDLTPEVVLHRTLDNINNIKSVVVVIERKDGMCDVDWSKQHTSSLCMAGKALDIAITDAVRYDGE